MWIKETTDSKNLLLYTGYNNEDQRVWAEVITE